MYLERYRSAGREDKCEAGLLTPRCPPVLQAGGHSVRSTVYSWGALYLGSPSRCGIDLGMQFLVLWTVPARGPRQPCGCQDQRSRQARPGTAFASGRLPRTRLQTKSLEQSCSMGRVRDFAPARSCHGQSGASQQRYWRRLSDLECCKRWDR